MHLRASGIIRECLAVTLESTGVEEESHALNISFSGERVTERHTGHQRTQYTVNTVNTDTNTDTIGFLLQ